MTSVRSAPDPEGARPSMSTNPGLAVAAVARRLGVAPATLRTWDRRYGLGPSQHRAGSHRRYTDDDVARLVVMRRLTLDGVAPADAARAALAADDDELDAHRGAVSFDEHGAEGGTDADDDLDADDAAPEPAAPSRPFLRAVPGGEGARGTAPRALGVREAPRPTRVSDVVDAAIAYDQRTCDRLLRIPAGGDPAAWWSDLVEPALERLAERTVLAGPGEVPEVVLANATLGALREYTQASEDAIVAAGGPPRNHPSRMRRIVLVFAAPDEPLPLAAHALAASLASHGAMARIVTGPANVHRTLEIVTMVRPSAVAMVTTQARPDLGIVHAAHEANPSLPFFVGLPSDEAAGDLPLAATVHRVRSFPGLLHELLAVVR
ncbi:MULTISPECIES: MerR family transcriptional regulator [Cellulosimicrobium]|uniref:MerR family transcriptional regulator n=1 Tax=Cellulosimicrobium TaxID=157920 RepID=UPI0020982249|nr:MerR family transcriptional regulator [Cellulosimicrobium cellulans]MCO7272583.1 MerR family transcriptional regulator [Cellulosimicrobium cellulans]